MMVPIATIEEPVASARYSFKEMEGRESCAEECTRDGSLDTFGRPALRGKTGGWRSGMFLLADHGLATLAIAGVEVNLVLFAKRVLKQSNAEASNTFSRWMGTVHLFSVIGAFLSDSYLGRYKSCVIFQAVFTLGLAVLSLSTHFLLLKPHGCGKSGFLCDSHSSLEIALFYLSIYLVALGNGASEPSLATFGSDQFDEEDVLEKRLKTSFFSYFYVAFNMGSIFSETVLVYLENSGNWVLGFWISTSCGLAALVLFLSGSLRYRHFRPCGNPLSRFCQVIVVATRKLKVEVPSHEEGLYEGAAAITGNRRIRHTEGFRFLDRAAILTIEDRVALVSKHSHNPWHLCTVTQVEEVKCVLRLIPIWLCSSFYSMVFIQMTSLFILQGAAMNTSISRFHIPPASMTVFDITSTSVFIILYDNLIVPCYTKLMKKKPSEFSDLQKMGIGFLIEIAAIMAAGLVEIHRLRHTIESDNELASISIFWQVPQYVVLGVSEAFMYVGQLEFFTAQIPDGLKSLGIGLCMSSSSIGSYLSSLFLTIVMKITKRGRQPGWVPSNLNEGHMDKFFFLSAILTALNLVAFIFCAKRHKGILMEQRGDAKEMDKVIP